MSKLVPSPAARDSLRRLATPHAIDFGARLLHRGTGGTIPFREFLAVARDYVAERPDQSAVYLAALVALDMVTDDRVTDDRSTDERSTDERAGDAMHRRADAGAAPRHSAKPSAN